MSEDLVEAKECHCVFIFDILRWLLNGKSGKKPAITFPKTNLSAPLFVTFKRRRSDGSWRLRGCKGTFQDYPLQLGLERFTEISAFHDRRFSEIKSEEIDKLRCTVSFLSKFEKMGNKLHDWEIGKHGVKIFFTHPILKTKAHATFLPHVAHEKGYSHETTLKRLYSKAGFKGEVTEELKAGTRLNRYQCSKFTLTYEQYKKFRNL